MLQAIPLLFGLVTIVFLLARLLPGDITSVFLSPTTPPAVIEQIRAQLGLDRPLLEQYVLWLKSIAIGDLGYSFTHSAPVIDVLWQVFPKTLLLGISAILLEIFLAVMITMPSVLNPGSWLDRFLSNSTLVVYTLPSFWIGIILLTLFSYNLGWFPSSQMFSSGVYGVDDFESFFDLLSHLVLPALTVAIPGAAGLARFLRSNAMKTLNEEYVLSARSYGLSENKIFFSVVLPNSISPVISLIGIEIGILLTGMLVTETLFAWPGMGRLAVVAIFARDYPLILGCTLVAGIVVVVGSFIADVLNAIIDPRVRLS